MIVSCERLHFDDRQSWLRGRSRGLGASDAASVMGLSPWRSNLQLWLEKTGQAQGLELDGNEAVELGKSLESPVRQIFAVKHPEYEVEYYPYDILYQPERPWLFATLDGELLEKATGRHGIYEGKSSRCGKRSDWAKWRGQVPSYYFCQVCHQMLATGADFAWLAAFLLNLEGDACEYREYYFERSEHTDDIELVLEREIRFMGYVQSNEMPPIVLNGLN